MTIKIEPIFAKLKNSNFRFLVIETIECLKENINIFDEFNQDNYYKYCIVAIDSDTYKNNNFDFEIIRNVLEDKHTKNIFIIVKFVQKT